MRIITVLSDLRRRTPEYFRDRDEHILADTWSYELLYTISDMMPEYNDAFIYPQLGLVR